MFTTNNIKKSNRPHQMNAILLVGLGGFIGAVLRFLLSGLVQGGRLWFPFGTFFVNFVGCLALGLLMFFAESGGNIHSDLRLFLTIGILGAFTTMSTFAYESFRLLEESRYLLFTVNFLGGSLLNLSAIYIARIIVYWRSI